MHLNERRGSLRKRVPQRVGVMRERRGVEHHRRPCVGRLVHPVDKLGFVVGLAHVNVQAERTARGTAQLDKVTERHCAVHLGLAGPEPGEVRPVQHKDVSHDALTFA